MSAVAEPEVVYQLDRPGGSVAYDVSGSGPLVVCVPGMGDLRTVYRYLRADLVAAGYRVAVMDLRGHGASSVGFDQYDDVATAGDVAALIAHLGGPAVVVGNSMAAGSAVIVAAEQPELVSRLVLVGPFVRNPAISGVTQAMFRVLMAPLWASAAWTAYLPKLYAGRRPADFDEHRAAIKAALGRPGYAKAFSLTTRTTHAPAESALDGVRSPALVVMGELDPDFKDPGAEAAWIGEQLHGEVVVVPECGHYPQAQQPEAVSAAVIAFLGTVGTNGTHGDVGNGPHGA